MRWLAIAILFVVVACGDSKEADTAPTPEQLARQHCPEAARDACTVQVVQFAAGARPAALCVEGSRWYMETPQGAAGAACSGGGTIRVIVGGP